MASTVVTPIDISQPGKYPIVLSDALLGKPSKDLYTGVRYNYKPDISSNSPSSTLKPSDTEPSAYDLSLKDNSDRYSYKGARTAGDGQFVLIFDPVREVFVLHQVDSTFDMNVVSAPWSNDESTLRSDYPQLEPEPIQAPTPQRKPSRAKKAAAGKAEAPRKKAEKPKKKAAVREPTPDEDEDSDDPFTVEDPDTMPSNQYRSQPVFHAQGSHGSDEDEDAEHESYEEDEHNQDVDHLELPSPVNNDNMDEDEWEGDLEKDLEEALMGAPDPEPEPQSSDESEEE